jgi:LmbE family N-acetylglucosaminyl deacetylase
MLDLIANLPARSKARVLCIGAHCDDIEIGCGGTLRVLQGRGSQVTIDWVVASGTAERRRETQRAMNLLVEPAHRGELHFGEFSDGRFPAEYGRVKEFFESLKDLPRPDVILCHERADLHQDHRIVNEMVWNTFRDQLILEYEIPKWDGGLGQPNLYVPISAAQAKRKVAALMTAYASQRTRDWFTPDTFMALLRLRGIECRAPSGLAEAFHARKIRFAGFR